MSWLWLLGGLIWGGLMVLWQAWSIRRLEIPESSATAALNTVAGTLGRLIVMTILLIFALKEGIRPALFFFGGWWIGRWLVLWQVDRRAD